MRRISNARLFVKGLRAGYGQQKDLFTKRYRAVRVPAPDEREIQIAVMQHYKLRRLPGVVGWHTPNGGFRTKAEASLLRAMGVLPGVADLTFTFPAYEAVGPTPVTRARPALFLELKAKRGRLSPDQKVFRDLMLACGHIYEWADTLDGALEILQRHKVIR